MVKDKAMEVLKHGKRELPDKDESPSKKAKVNRQKSCKEQYGQKLKDKLGLELPDDFFAFFDFIQDEKAAAGLACAGLYLTGPFDVLLDKIPSDTTLSKSELLMHGRHYYDTPEMMTVLYMENNSGFHIGYFRDDPKDLPCLLVSGKSEINGELSSCGDNLFAAVYIFCKTILKSIKDVKKVKDINNFCKALEEESKGLKYVLESSPPSSKKRQKAVVAKTFHKLGIVVPMDKTGVGYRELPETDRDLKKIFTKIARADTEEKKNAALDELDEIITLVQFANDECDYGMGFELGIDLFIFGNDALHGVISHLLPLAYQLLGRNLYADVISLHLENRVKHGFINKIV